MKGLTVRRVWVVSHGEKSEGSGIVSIHKFRKNAEKAALAVKCCFSGGWQPDGEDCWENGCDFVKIQEIEVQS